MSKKRNRSVVRIEEPKSSILTHRRRKQKAHKDRLDTKAFQKSQSLLKSGETKKRIEDDPMVRELNKMLGLQSNTNTEIIVESDPRSKCRSKYYTKSGRGRGGRFANV